MDELISFAAATIIMTVALLSFRGELTVYSVLLYAGASAAALLLREFGQRTIAQWMEAESVLQLSTEGSITTLFGAVMTYMTGLPVILLFPVFNEHDVESYEHWGKSIDAMWIKRRYWIVSVGILMLFAGWFVFRMLNLPEVAEVISMFTIFQLLPFNYSQIPTGELDGSIIIRWSGFVWLIFMGGALLSLLLI